MKINTPPLKKRNKIIPCLCFGSLIALGMGVGIGYVIWHSTHKNTLNNDLDFSLNFDTTNNRKSFFQHQNDCIKIDVTMHDKTLAKNNKDVPNFYGYWNIEGTVANELQTNGFLANVSGYVAQGATSDAPSTWTRNDNGSWVGSFSIILQKDIVGEIDPFDIGVVLTSDVLNLPPCYHKISIACEDSNEEATADYLSNLTFPITNSSTITFNTLMFTRNYFQNYDNVQATTNLINNLTERVKKMVDDKKLVMPTTINSAINMYTNEASFKTMMNSLQVLDNPSSFISIILLENVLALLNGLPSNYACFTGHSWPQNATINYNLRVLSLSYSGLDGSKKLLTGTFEQEWISSTNDSYHFTFASHQNDDTHYYASNMNGAYYISNTNIDWANMTLPIEDMEEYSYQATTNKGPSNRAIIISSTGGIFDSTNTALFAAMKNYLHVVYPGVVAFNP